PLLLSCFFFSTHSSSPVIYPLSLHDALPIYLRSDLCFHFISGGIFHDFLYRPPHRPLRIHQSRHGRFSHQRTPSIFFPLGCKRQDRKSTRLNSSHVSISYAVFCLKKKKKQNT